MVFGHSGRSVRRRLGTRPTAMGLIRLWLWWGVPLVAAVVVGNVLLNPTRSWESTVVLTAPAVFVAVAYLHVERQAFLCLIESRVAKRAGMMSGVLATRAHAHRRAGHPNPVEAAEADLRSFTSGAVTSSQAKEWAKAARDWARTFSQGD